MCRNILSINDAFSEVFKSDGNNLVIKFITDANGVTDRKLRVGGFGVELVKNGMVKKLYGDRSVVI